MFTRQLEEQQKESASAGPGYDVNSCLLKNFQPTTTVPHRYRAVKFFAALGIVVLEKLGGDLQLIPWHIPLSPYTPPA